MSTHVRVTRVVTYQFTVPIEAYADMTTGEEIADWEMANGEGTLVDDIIDETVKVEFFEADA